MTSADQALSPPRLFPLRCALAYGAAVAVNGVILPYFPVWLQGLAFSSFEIGIVLAAQMILRVAAAPFAGMLADRMTERSSMLAWSAILSLITAVMLFGTTNFWPVLIVFGLQAAVFAPYPPIVEAITVTGVRRWGFEYGAMRVWGSIGFVAVTLAVGELIGIWGAGIVPSALVVTFLVTLAVAFAAPKLGTPLPLPAAQSASASARRTPLHLHVLMLGAALIQASHGMYYAFSTLYWQQAGLSSSTIGVLWSAGVVAEILVFFSSGWIARRVSPWTLMRWGCVASVIRWALFPLPLGLWGTLALQLSHALTFALVHLGLQHRLVESVREDQEASVQGAYVFYGGALLGLSTLASGLLYKQFGGFGFLGMSLIALAGLATISLAARLQPQRSGSGG
ncbi:MFS transporter [Neorhizobium lilium]|uniref:MFS transporter n=1 Tax=Neorhizobium lilium TaxID=2503024 RepID=A0A444LCJ3_9HYPH|nr:MFS transporter [Neorhizobium lilium]RWX75505.1 MFS transporter [Neorhizobium lilium]